jgi:hypothetical protein
MKKTLTLFSLLLLMVAVHAEIVYNGDSHNVASWNAKQMPVADFPVLANASAGDVIAITVTDVDGSGRIYLQNTAWKDLGYDAYEVTTGVYPFVLTAAAAEEVKTNGLIVTGEKYTFNKIELLYKKTLWTGDVDATTNWEQSDALNNAIFADLKEGDILGVTVTEIHEGDWHSYALRANYETNIIEHNMSTAATGVDVLSAEVVTSLKNDRIILVGSYLHATEIHTYVTEKGLTPLWSGTQVIGEWSNELDNIPASKLTGLKVGNILCVRVSAIGTEAAPRVTLAYGDSWENFSPVVEYYFQGGDIAPMVVEFPVTYKMEQQLRGNKLVVRGVNYTVTDVYIKSGTPVTNVAAYLNVTAAKMATYVLPFNVPALPEGVKAYNLTNDGTNEITATEVSSLTADKPVLIIADEGEYEFLSEDGASDDISGKTGTYTNGALVGTYQSIADVPTTSAANYNYILQNGADGVAFYQVKTTGCSIAPYHAYLSCGYNSQAGGTPAPMRIRFRQDAATGVSQAANSNPAIRKRMIDGQLFIEREGTLYTTQGQIVK